MLTASLSLAGEVNSKYAIEYNRVSALLIATTPGNAFRFPNVLTLLFITKISVEKYHPGVPTAASLIHRVFREFNSELLTGERSKTKLSIAIVRSRYSEWTSEMKVKL